MGRHCEMSPSKIVAIHKIHKPGSYFRLLNSAWFVFRLKITSIRLGRRYAFSLAYALHKRFFARNTAP
ncbi:hypothetical protein [Campylobacter troglodytis]|uniref:hypothetical protein n=1 Tax=Campylobacter troglodytis TaxID=654363 RepID=UPI00115BFA79|nr:hypothetical protein [Campylobacter troglodytis]